MSSSWPALFPLSGRPRCILNDTHARIVANTRRDERSHEVTFSPFNKVRMVSKSHQPNRQTQERGEMTRQTAGPRVIHPHLRGVIDGDESNFTRERTQDWQLAVLAEPEDYSRLAYSIDQVVEDIPQVIDAMSEHTVNMSPERVKAIREGLGLTQVALAATLRLGPTGKRSVIRWETGDTPVPGPVSVALEALASGWEPGSHYGPNARAEQVIQELESAVLHAQEQVRRLRLTPKGTQ